jgi:hypothetical protein
MDRKYGRQSAERGTEAKGTPSLGTLTPQDGLDPLSFLRIPFKFVPPLHSTSVPHQ